MPVRTAFFCLASAHHRNRRPRSAGRVPCPKEGRLETRGDSLLHDLIQHEQRQSERVRSARSEADAIVAAAEQEAANVLAAAQREADAAAEAALEAARTEADEITERAMAAGRAEAQRISDAAEARRERAMQRVLEQVLP